VAYAAKPFKETLHINPDWLAAACIPFVALGLRQLIKRRLQTIASPAARPGRDH